MSFQIFDDGACIRIQRLGDQNNIVKVLMLSKEQVKTIDVIKDNIVRIDIGEGPLNNIFINFLEVTFPVLSSADELRNEINAMLKSDIYDGDNLSEVTQRNILTKLEEIAALMQSNNVAEANLSNGEPSRIDESNPYMIYKGWHKLFGDEQANEWAIQRVRRENDQIIYEWAFGTQKQIYKWWDRASFAYAPYDHDLPMEVPLPPAPPVDPGTES
jgi:hypothetical protein